MTDYLALALREAGDALVEAEERRRRQEVLRREQKKKEDLRQTQKAGERENLGASPFKTELESFQAFSEDAPEVLRPDSEWDVLPREIPEDVLEDRLPPGDALEQADRLPLGEAPEQAERLPLGEELERAEQAGQAAKILRQQSSGLEAVFPRRGRTEAADWRQKEEAFSPLLHARADRDPGGAEEIDRIFRRDSRRYDGGFFLF